MITDDEVSKKMQKYFANKPPVKTLRDEFAMAALTGLIARANEYDLEHHLEYILGKASYIADEAMKARERK